MDFANYWFSSGSGGGGGYQIGESLRFRGGSYSWRSRMQREQTNSGSETTATYSYWTKAPQYGNARFVFYGGSSAGNHLAIACNGSHGEGGNNSISNPLRDESAWYHIVQVWDTTNGNSNNTLRHYVNGVRQTSWNSGGTASGNMKFGRTGSVTIGGAYNSSGQWASDSYTLAEFHFIDGQALDPEGVFGEFNADGVWAPIQYNGTYGGNGWYLDFSDPANIGADRSGNGNNFTPTGFELTDTTSLDYDWMADSPTTNTATLNPLFRSNTAPSYSQNNQSVSGATTSVEGTHGVSSGRWYFECIMTGGGSQIVGICGPTLSNYTGNLYDQSTAYTYQFQGKKGHAQTLTNYGASYGNNDVIGIAFDADAGEITFFKNGTSQGVAFTGISGTFLPAVSNNGNAATHNINCGQRPFRHNPPAGYEPWNTAVMADVAITNPSDHFRVILDTGANILTNAQAAFPEGLWWIKDRANSSNHRLLNSMTGTGTTKQLPGNATGSYSAPSGNSVAWCWSAPESYTPSASGVTVQAARRNLDAGFAMIRYTGAGSAATIQHGLGAVPRFIIAVDERSGQTVQTGHVGMDASSPWSYVMALGASSGRSSSTAWNSTAPTATTISLNTPLTSNTVNYTIYVWAEVPGFSSFAHHRSNGIRDGVFVNTGHRPQLFMSKSYNATNNWVMRTASATPTNPINRGLYANTDQVELQILECDLYSNGFKWREDGGQGNDNGQMNISCSWAEHPFGGGNVSPSPAR